MVSVVSFVFFFFKQKTAYEMRISDWSSDVCSSDLISPAIGSSAPRASASSAGRSAIATPPFCSSAPILTWTKHAGRRPALSIARASAVTSETRSTEWIASNSATAPAALVDWTGPVRGREITGDAARKTEKGRGGKGGGG